MPSRRRKTTARRRGPLSKREYDRDWGTPDEQEIEPAPLLDEEFPASIFAVPDKFWGFYAAGRVDHPGVCVDCHPADGTARLVQGRDAATRRGSRLRVVTIEPTRGNGLTKPTAFELTPRVMPLHRVRLLYPERYMGRMDHDDFQRLTQRIAASSQSPLRSNVAAKQ